MIKRIAMAVGIGALAAFGAPPADTTIDRDNDGMPDYAAYLATNTLNLGTADYFAKVGLQYVGELLTDHDFMEDRLERLYSFGDPAVYDPHGDADEDGWSNWAELRAMVRAGRNKTKYVGYPQPTVTMVARYNGYKRVTGATLRVDSYTDADCARRDASFSVPFGGLRGVCRATLPAPSEGWLREGKTTFIVSVGEPGERAIMGVARNVDVGWSKVKFEVELLEESPVSSRPSVEEITTGDNKVYVYRYSINNAIMPPGASLDYGPVLVVTNLGERTYLTEGDFLSDNDFDLDWTLFQSRVMRNATVWSEGYNVTQVVYRVYGRNMNLDVEYHQSNSNHVPYVEIVKNFGRTRATAVPVAPGEDSSILYKARPTFRWKMGGELPDSFTAFKIEVADNSGKVWDSGIHLAPPRNENGEYLWQAPLYPGDQTMAGKRLQDNTNYMWRVSMYNSKYQNDAWSASRQFRMNVYGTNEANNAGAFCICAKVRYFGPGATASGIAATNGMVRVEAFTSPDFSGDAEGRCYVGDAASLTNAADAANVTILGLAPGTYYLRAYIDSNGDFKRSPWESWGYAYIREKAEDGAIYSPARVTIGEGAPVPTLTVYIEDCDTDQDGLPDVWEYDTAGEDKTDFLLKKGPMHRSSGGYITVNPNLQENF